MAFVRMSGGKKPEITSGVLGRWEGGNKTFTYTAPKKGKYIFSWVAEYLAPDDDCYVYIYKNGVVVYAKNIPLYSRVITGTPCMLDLVSGDDVTISISASNQANQALAVYYTCIS